jgi:hypothetical protein
VCNLVFVLQSIKDYHLRAEYDAFANIRHEQLPMLEDRYTTKINTAVDICNSIPPGDPQSNDAPDGGHLDASVLPGESVTEFKLRRDVIRWVFHIYFHRSDQNFLKDYKDMKAFILLHAMSVVSRGEDGQSKWRKSAARIMTELNNNRFNVCLGITLSFFLRRQIAIPNPDHPDVVQQQKGLWGMDIWPKGLRERMLDPNQPSNQKRHRRWRIREHLKRISNPVTFRGPFRLPSTGILHSQVLLNFQIYIEEAVSYHRHLRALGPPGELAHKRAWALQVFIRNVWINLKDTFLATASEWDVDDVKATGPFLDSEFWGIGPSGM